jgi:hypothetical protein
LFIGLGPVGGGGENVGGTGVADDRGDGNGTGLTKPDRGGKEGVGTEDTRGEYVCAGLYGVCDSGDQGVGGDGSGEVCPVTPVVC